MAGDGTVTVPNGVSATGGLAQITLNTTPISVDPGDYSGRWSIDASGATAVTGALTVSLVPGLDYRFYAGGFIGGPYGDFTVIVDGTGFVSVPNGESGTGSQGSLSLSTVAIEIDPGTYAGGWFLTGHPAGQMGVDVEVVVPGVDYRLETGLGFGSFLVSAPCEVDPSQFLLSGVEFNVTCTNLLVNVLIDIKPGSDPNSVNLCSGGATPVAIFGSETFDVNDIDPDSLRLAEASVKVVGKSDRTLCSTQDQNGDGWDDLVCHFITLEMTDVLDEESSSATLHGRTYDDVEFEGVDAILIVKDC